MSQSYYKSESIKLKEELLTQKNILSTALQAGWAVALWQNPEDKQQHLIVDVSGNIQRLKPDLEESKFGFLVSPFLNPKNDKTYLIQADLHFSYQNQEIITEGFEMETKNEVESFLNLIRQNIRNSEKINLKNSLKSLVAYKIERNYKDLVQKGIEAIEQKYFQKVVLSRTRVIEYPVDFDFIAVFQKLCELYPKAFSYLFHIPKVGTWMGASPETLISTDKNQIFRTVALAGTQALRQGISLKEIPWTQKEIEEQALVSRYIINCFKKIRLREFEEEGPKTVVAGNLMHLKTTFSVDMQATNFPQLGTVMLDLLHPTSAVCGMPKDTSLEFILKNETYQREFYSGYLGPVNFEGESHIFVNLRCMQFFNDCILLYAGAGITEDSSPEKEYQETEMKFKTMLRVLGK